MTELIGWASSFVLLLTIGKQIHKQWRDDNSEGVSKWLFVGQLTASGGFFVYSYLVRNWVFVVTNLLMVLAALIGLAIVLHHRAKRARRPIPGPGTLPAPAAGVAGPVRHRCGGGPRLSCPRPDARNATGTSGQNGHSASWRNRQTQWIQNPPPPPQNTPEKQSDAAKPYSGLRSPCADDAVAAEILRTLDGLSPEQRKQVLALVRSMAGR